MARNFWRDTEIVTMLDIIREHDILQHFNGKRYKSAESFKRIHEEMVIRGIESKSAEQIKTKWKALKSAYNTSKRNNTLIGPERPESEYFPLLEEILSSTQSSNVDSINCKPSIDTPLEIQVDESISPIDVEEFLTPTGSVQSEESTSRTLTKKRGRKKDLEIVSLVFEQQNKILEKFFEYQREAEARAAENRAKELKIIMDGFSTTIATVLRSINQMPSPSNNSPFTPITLQSICATNPDRNSNPRQNEVEVKEEIIEEEDIPKPKRTK